MEYIIKEIDNGFLVRCDELKEAGAENGVEYCKDYNELCRYVGGQAVCDYMFGDLHNKNYSAEHMLKVTIEYVDIDNKPFFEKE